MEKITEASSNYNNLEQLSTRELLEGINAQDQLVPIAIAKISNELENFIEACFERMHQGGRLFYIGAGTSGRLGIVDASECPPTFGVDPGRVIGLIAGGDNAIRKAVEFAEDDTQQGWKDILAHQPTPLDTIVGIAASGTTPYVLGAIQAANESGLLTAGISCNPGSPLAHLAQHALTPVVGPEFVTGSTRMKSGTAQKLILNMISTSLMIKLGHVKGNRMVDMQLSNEKLVDRGAKMVAAELNIAHETAQQWLLAHGSVRKAVEAYQNQSNNEHI
ncbi:MAG: N-acetylmuramic acid 6-phosphate etherase [Bacteroidota bacterium]|jgi:N-acetylmuramic acid 6-phosphate etherase